MKRTLVRIAFAAALVAGPLALIRTCAMQPRVIEPESAPLGLLGPDPAGGFVPSTRAAVGDITSVVAGNGLTGGASSGTATLDVAVGTGLSVAADAVNLNLAGASCSAGSFVSAIGATGTGTCTAETGDISAVTAGTGLTGGGASGAVTLTANLAGASCSNGQAITSLSATGTGTCGSAVPNQYGGTHLEWIDEWLIRSGPASGAPIGIWSSVPNGAAASTNLGTLGTTTRPGIVELGTGSSGTGSSSYQTNPQAIDFGSGSWTMQWTGGFPTLSTVAEEYAALVGFSDSTTINVTDGCYFLYDRGNVATSGPNSGNADAWSCWCASNSARTTYLINGSGNSDESFALGTATVGALTLPSTNIRTLEVRMTGTTRAEFYADGVKVCNINTNIPSGASRLTGAVFGLFKSNGTTARTMAADRTRVAVDLTTARTP